MSNSMKPTFELPDPSVTLLHETLPLIRKTNSSEGVTVGNSNEDMPDTTSKVVFALPSEISHKVAINMYSVYYKCFYYYLMHYVQLTLLNYDIFITID